MAAGSPSHDAPREESTTCQLELTMVLQLVSLVLVAVRAHAQVIFCGPLDALKGRAGRGGLPGEKRTSPREGA
eukprot:2131517-Pyramimonas_sp.AAC.1